MLRVYCDTGAYRRELKSLESQGAIKVFQFKYENRNRHIRHSAPPSAPRWTDFGGSWNDLGEATWEDFGKTSDRWARVAALLGANSIRDAKHLDSAYMASCQVFLTSDKHDIVSRRAEIAALLGIVVLHFRDDWQEFLALTDLRGSNGTP